MFDSKNDYALNKMDPEAIVCKSVTGVHIRLTREDFASEEEFREWKEFSDDDYYKMVNGGRDFYDNCISLEEAWSSIGVSAEDSFFAPLVKAEWVEQQSILLQQVKEMLTKIQYRRLRMYYVEGKGIAQIAALERVTPRAVYLCLATARKAICKQFVNI